MGDDETRDLAGAVEGFSLIRLTSADGSSQAEFVPEANMLCHSFSHQGTELLDRGAGVRAYAERGKTMGIPLLHPWANRLSGLQYRAAGKSVTLREGDNRIPTDPEGLPIHGALPGLLRWEVEDGVTPDRLAARLRWTSDEVLDLFPFAHELSVQASLSPGCLVISTTLRAVGDDRVPVSFGYHPYLRVPGGGRAAWQVQLGAFRRLVLDQRMIPTGERKAVQQRAFELADTSLDDGYDALAVPPEFSATGSEATMTVTFREGYSYAQAYAPPGHDFICFEPMTAPTNALNSGDGLQLVAPGEQYRAAFEITVSRTAARA